MSNDRTESINIRIASRNIPSEPLQPFLNCRPTSTKYAWFPIVDYRRHIKQPLKTYNTYKPSKVFLPTSTTAPRSGFEVNVESDLRSQIFSLQSADQSVYVPTKESDMYILNYLSKDTPPISQTDLLFRKDVLPPFNPNTLNNKTSGFNISTRQHLFNL